MYGYWTGFVQWAWVTGWTPAQKTPDSEQTGSHECAS